MRPSSNSVFVYIFWKASTSDGVQYSGLKTLHCTPSDVLALPKIQAKVLYEKGLYSSFLGHHFIQIKTEKSNTNHLE